MNMEPTRPNESGATPALVRWQVETPVGWLGAWDREPFDMLARRLAAAEQMAQALRAIVDELADDDDFSAKQIARNFGATSLAAWEAAK